MTGVSNNIMAQLEISTLQIKFLMDLMMGTPTGSSKQLAHQNNVDDTILFGQLEKCLQNAPASAE